MGKLKTILDVLEYAIGREAEASEFYMALASQVKETPMASFFESLARQEMEHKSLLELEIMKEGRVAQTVGRMPDLPETEYQFEPEQVASLTYPQALGIAIEKERRSFRLYAQMAPLVLDEAMRETLLNLAEEEARHLVAFETEYEKAVSQNRQ